MNEANERAREDAPPPLPGEGTPDGAMLREAFAAFEAGDYATVRALAGKLRGSRDPQIADAALDLGRRVAVDPVQIGFLVACFAAWLVVFYVYVLR